MTAESAGGGVRKGCSQVACGEPATTVRTELTRIRWHPYLQLLHLLGLGLVVRLLRELVATLIVHLHRVVVPPGAGQPTRLRFPLQALLLPPPRRLLRELALDPPLPRPPHPRQPPNLLRELDSATDDARPPLAVRLLMTSGLFVVLDATVLECRFRHLRVQNLELGAANLTALPVAALPDLARHPLHTTEAPVLGKGRRAAAGKEGPVRLGRLSAGE